MPVRVACKREVRPERHQFVREIGLTCIEGVLDSVWSAMPGWKQILDIGGVVRKGEEPGHPREVERRRPVIELINIDRDLGREDPVEYPLATYRRLGPDPVVGDLWTRVGAQWIQRQDGLGGPSRVRRRGI